MMGEDFWWSWFAFALLGSTFVMAIVSLAFNLYLSQRYLKEIIDALPNSRYVYLWAPLRPSQGWLERYWLMNGIATIVVWSSRSLRYGELDPFDFQNFPRHLKRLVHIHSVLLYGASLWSLGCSPGAVLAPGKVVSAVMSSTPLIASSTSASEKLPSVV